VGATRPCGLPHRVRLTTDADPQCCFVWQHATTREGHRRLLCGHPAASRPCPSVPQSAGTIATTTDPKHRLARAAAAGRDGGIPSRSHRHHLRVIGDDLVVTRRSSRPLPMSSMSPRRQSPAGGDADLHQPVTHSPGAHSVTGGFAFCSKALVRIVGASGLTGYEILGW
jgi:hypothetical protein